MIRHHERAGNKPRTPAHAAIGDYIRDIGIVPRLTYDEEVALGRAIRAGDRAAREKLYICNLPMVMNIARKYVGRGLAMDDLVAEGNIGLGRAVDLFDPERGLRFSTFAFYQISALIYEAIKVQVPLLHVPRGAVDFVFKCRRQKDPAAFVASFPAGRQAQHEAAWHAMQARENALFIDSKDWQYPLEDGREAAASSIEAQEWAELLRRALATLKPRDRDVLTAWYGIGRDAETFREIGERIGKSREYTRQILMHTQRRLKRWFEHRHIQFEDLL